MPSEHARDQTLLTFLHTGNPTGLKFTVEHRGRRAIFDFGREHAPARALFSMGVEPRPESELADLVEVGVAPRIEGVYSPALLPGSAGWDAATALFITHLHLDHVGLVKFVDPRTPIYYPAAMEPLRSACVAAGYLGWPDPPGTALPDRGRVRWGEIEVEAVAVDHDLPGATGYLVRTPDLFLAFTGDHRWHGLHPELTAGFARAARGVDVLIQEGVLLGLEPNPTSGEPPPPPPPPPLTEAQVIAAYEPLLRGHPGLAIVNLYPMNRERVAGFAAAARAAGRRFLMEPQSARMAGWDGVFDDPAPVAADPAGHAVMLTLETLPSLIDLRPPEGSVYIHSGGAPLGPYDPAWPVLEAWAERFGLELVRLGASGHSWREDIVRMVSTVRPGVVVPVHSRVPAALSVPGVAALVPETLRPYPAEELKALAGAAIRPGC